MQRMGQQVLHSCLLPVKTVTGTETEVQGPDQCWDLDSQPSAR